MVFSTYFLKKVAEALTSGKKRITRPVRQLLASQQMINPVFFGHDRDRMIAAR